MQSYVRNPRAVQTVQTVQTQPIPSLTELRHRSFAQTEFQTEFFRSDGILSLRRNRLRSDGIIPLRRSRSVQTEITYYALHY